jgi:hypothetical protein
MSETPATDHYIESVIAQHPNFDNDEFRAVLRNVLVQVSDTAFSSVGTAIRNSLQLALQIDLNNFKLTEEQVDTTKEHPVEFIKALLENTFNGILTFVDRVSMLGPIEIPPMVVQPPTEEEEPLPRFTSNEVGKA